MGSARYALLLFVAAAITVVVASCAPRQAVNELDAELLAFLRERDKLWNIPLDQGGIRESDVSHIVCPMVSLEGLREIVEIDNRAMAYNPVTQFGNDWSHQFSLNETTGFMRVPTVFILLSADGSRCRAGFRMYGSI